MQVSEVASCHGMIYTSPLISDVEHHLMGLLAICMSLQNSSKSFICFQWGCVSFIVELYDLFIYSDY